LEITIETKFTLWGVRCLIKETESKETYRKSATDKKELSGGSQFKIISTEDGSTRDQCCILVCILHRLFIGFGLLLQMETLLPTRNEATRATCTPHYRKLSPIYY